LDEFATYREMGNEGFSHVPRGEAIGRGKKGEREEKHNSAIMPIIADRPQNYYLPLRTRKGEGSQTQGKNPENSLCIGGISNPRIH